MIAEQKFAVRDIKKLFVNGVFCDIKVEPELKFIFEGYTTGNFQFKTDFKSDEIISDVEQNSRRG